jgi:hypothetical protein
VRRAERVVVMVMEEVRCVRMASFGERMQQETVKEKWRYKRRVRSLQQMADVMNLLQEEEDESEEDGWAEHIG